MLRKIALSLILALLLGLVAVAVPKPVAAQQLGPWVDEIRFSEVPQTQAVASVSAGDTDIYIFALDTAADKIAAREDPNINTFEAPSGKRNLLLNPVPHGAGVGGFNPFTLQQVREAMWFAMDRQHVINEIYGGFGTPEWTPFHRFQPDYVRDAAFFAGIEAEYAYNPAKAKAMVESAMAGVAGVTLVNDKWQFNGAPIEVIIFHRIGDPRWFTGLYAMEEVEKLGFTVVMEPGTFDEAFDTVLYGDPTAGTWHIYTGGWGGGSFVQFEDGDPNFYLNGDLATSIWDFYTPPPSLTVPCEALEASLYVGLDERQELMRTCIRAGMKDGVRQFLLADADVYPSHIGTSDITADLFAGYLNFFALKTVRKGTTPGGILNVHQPIHSDTAWNLWGGFQDVYSENQRVAFNDPPVINHPHLGTGIPFRAQFDITTVGPGGVLDVPTDPGTQVFNTSTNLWETAPAGLTSRSYVDFDYTPWGSWHHGEAITMEDVQSSLGCLFRVADVGGDLGAVSPSTAAITAYQLYITNFRAVNFTGPDTVRVWYDSWNPDETVIAFDASVPTWYPWEVCAVMTRSVLLGETAFHGTDAIAFDLPDLDLVKGAASLTSLNNATDFLRAANYIPPFVDATAAEATARWNALDAWRTTYSHLSVSNGPFYIDEVHGPGEPEFTILKAFRTGYPFDVDKWPFGEVRRPDVVLGASPDVIQTFPATFSFTTTLGGQSYDLIAQANWLVGNPATKEILFSGDAVRAGPGSWNAVLSAEQTTALTEGTYEFKTIVVGAEAALPVLTDTVFSTLSLSTAILSELAETLDNRLALFEDDITDIGDKADEAALSASSALTLTYVVLVVASIGIVIAVVSMVVLIRRLPPRT